MLEVEGTPHGVIRWPGETDKTNFEHSVPMTAAIRAVVDRVRRQRPAIGTACLFPKPTNRERPIGKERVRTWLLRAERAAGVPKQDGSLPCLPAGLGDRQKASVTQGRGRSGGLEAGRDAAASLHSAGHQHDATGAEWGDGAPGVGMFRQCWCSVRGWDSGPLAITLGSKHLRV